MWSEIDDEFIGEERNGFGETGTTVDPKRLIVNRHLIHLTCFVFLDFLGVFLIHKYVDFDGSLLQLFE